ncbi:MAG TPA: aminotransferase class III-fold pyridoxal phosphate-dependent enzyme [Actinomycetota bacterium]
MDAADAGIDLARVATLKAAEDERFAADHPRSLALLERGRASMPRGVPLVWMRFFYDHPPMFVAGADGSRFTDVDGNQYVDFHFGITIASTGHTPAPVVRAVTERIRTGIQFMLPTEDAVVVSEELARRWGLPKWQYALSSSQSINDAIRLARAITGRERLVVFEGKYHGQLAELLAVEGDAGEPEPEYHGLTDADIARTTILTWNDLDAVERTLAPGDVALLMAEPVLTNSGLVFPDPGFHEALRELTERHGALLLIDETQTLPMAYGGLMREMGLRADMVALGKSIGGGVPVGALGMTEEVARAIDYENEPYEVMGEAVDEPAIGGTMYGNALSMAALRAAVLEVWTEETHARMRALAHDLGDRMRAAIRAHGRDWDVYAFGNRAGYRFGPNPPRTNREAGDLDLPPVRHLQRVYMANRGIWDFGWWGGPLVSAQSTAEDVDRYAETFDAFLGDLMGDGR